MNIHPLAAFLCDDTLSVREVSLSLQTIGARTGIEETTEALRSASSLYKYFEALAYLFPTLPIQRFINCRYIYANLKRRELSSHAPYAAELSQNEIFPFEKNTFDDFSVNESDKNPQSHALALAWILVAFQEWTPAHSKLSNILKAGNYANKVDMKVLVDLFSACGTPADTNWEVAKQIAPKSTLAFVEGFFSISAVVNSVQVSEKNTESLSLDKVDSPNASIRRPRNWADLAERERLAIHYSSMPHDELIRLCKILESTISAANAGAVEALLAALAILTCKTVDDVLSVSIEKDATESIRVDKYGGETSSFIVWTRDLNRTLRTQQSSFLIVMPEFVKAPLVGFLQKRQEGTIESCLPVSEISWSERAHAWIELHLKISKASLDRQLKHGLAREMYSQGVNSAVLSAFTSPVGIQNSKVPMNPLSYYISHSNHHFHLAYVSAISELFGKYGPKKFSYLFKKSTVSSDHKTDDVQNFTYFLEKIEQARFTKDKREEHNWLARYTLLLLIAGTGHRSSKAPFFFRHDLLLDEKLAFICDKNLVGSEARFVPLSEIILDQLGEYLKHLATNALYLLPNLKHRKNSAGSDLPCVSTGFFFTIDEKGYPRSLSTKDIEISPSEGRLSIKGFRKQLLTWLAEQGSSGFDIEALAGHNRDLHVFGHSSTWSVINWADRLRPKIDKYLKESGWQVIKCAIRQADGNSLSTEGIAVPLFTSSGEAYEGRDRLARAASKRAHKAIKTIVNREYLEEREWKLDSEAISDIQKRLALSLSGDPDAFAKTRRELAKWKDRISSSLEVASTPSFNYVVAEAGPVDVDFSRHYAIASQLKNSSLGRMGRISVNATKTEIVWERLSQIAFCLIAFDCVLSQVHLWGFIEAIVGGKTYRVADHLAIRTQVEDPPHRFEKSVVFSPITAAQIVAFHQLPFDHLDKAEICRQIQTRLSAFVVRLIGRESKASWSVDDVMTVFKPWWFIRIPGALYAVAISQTRGPALDLLSEVAIFYGTEPVLHPPLIGAAAALSKSFSSDDSKNLQTVALQELKKLFKDVSGRFELKEATRNKQNSRLRDALAKPPSSEMVSLLRERQIIKLLKEFVSYLLDEGGSREHRLSVDTIRDYLLTIAEVLIEVVWDVDLTIFDAEQFAELYQELKVRLEDKRHLGTVLPLFHRFLQRMISAPHVPGIGLGFSVSVAVRASILTPEQYDKTRSIIIADKTAHHWQTEAALHLLDLMYGYGLRSGEASGLTAKHVIGSTRYKVVVRANEIRSTKSRSPRLTWVANLPKPAHRRFGALVEEARLRKPRNQALFEDPRTDGNLYLRSHYSQLLTVALRTVTGSSNFVNYNLRHSYVTAAISAVMPNTGFSVPCNQYRKVILRDFDIAGTWSPIKSGSESWPFGMELIAMMAGHESSTTSAGSYWHVSHYDLHSYTEREFSLLNLNDQNIAAMLGLSASAISQSISKDKNEARWSKQRGAIYERVIRLKFRTAVDLVCGAKAISKKTTALSLQGTNALPLPTKFEISWDRINLLLSNRQRSGQSLEAFREALVVQHNFPLASAHFFVNTYEELLEETGFDDFEPTLVDINIIAPKFSCGVQRGITERGRFLATAQHDLLPQPGNAALLELLCTGWRTHVDVDKPFIVAEDSLHALKCVQALIALGIKPVQIHVHVVKYSITEIVPIIPLVNREKISFGGTRVSKGYARRPTSEIAFNVGQSKESNKPDGRDLHRAIFIMAIGLKLSSASKC